MYYSELLTKELVNLRNGKKLGWSGGYDLVIDAESGQLLALAVARRSWLGTRSDEDLMIPWTAIRRIGIDTIIVDLPATTETE